MDFVSYSYSDEKINDLLDSYLNLHKIKEYINKNDLLFVDPSKETMNKLGILMNVNYHLNKAKGFLYIDKVKEVFDYVNDFCESNKPKNS